MNKVNIQLSSIKYVMRGMAYKLHVQGCSVECPRCNNKNSWRKKKGSLNLNTLRRKINKIDFCIKKIVITGGEPLNQDTEALIELLKFLSEFNKEIWVITSFNLYEMPIDIKKYADFIKTGVYDPSYGPGKTVHGYKLSSKNQRVLKKGIDY